MTKTTLHTTRTAALLILLLLFFTGTVRAQTITVEHYVNLCREHALYGDDIPARIACGSALQLDPTVDEAGRIIAKLDIDNRNLLAATARLDRMQRERPHSDNLVLLAQVAIQNEDVAAVRKYLQDIEQLGSPTDPGAIPFIEARLNILLGQYPGAIQELLSGLVMAGQATGEVILTELELLIRMREFATAAEYFSFLPRPVTPRLAAQFDLYAAQVSWASGDIDAARSYYEAVLSNPGYDAGLTVPTPEHEYAIILLAQGDLTSAYEHWISADARSHTRWWLKPSALTWGAIVLIVVALLIVAESTVPQTYGTYAPINRQLLWSVGGSIAILAMGFVLTIILLGVISHLAVGSWLSILAPPNALILKMLFSALLLLTTGVIATIVLQAYTKSALHELRGIRVGWIAVFWGGVFVAGSTLLWEALVAPTANGTGVAFEMFAPPVVKLVYFIGIPVGEIFFRAFLIPTFELRYPRLLTTALSAGLYAMALGAPILLYVGIGLVFAWFYNRERSGLTLVFALFFGIALINILAWMIPAVRTLFF